MSLAPIAQIDWDGCAPVLGKVTEEGWVSAFFGRPAEDKRSLVEITGLVVRSEWQGR